MKRSMILLGMMLLATTVGVIGRIDAALSASGEAIALALTSTAPAAPMLAGPMNWGFAARFETPAAVIN